MLPVLDLEPVVASARTIDALAMLGDQALKPHPARRLEQLGTDLALLEWRYKDPLGPPAQQLRQVGLAQMQWQSAQIVPVIGQAVEGVELTSWSCLRECVVFYLVDPVRTAGHGFADFWTTSKFRQAPL
jgi:hypothetical protein